MIEDVENYSDGEEDYKSLLDIVTSQMERHTKMSISAGDIFLKRGRNSFAYF
jgi:hypothetical protein